jgi:hypothetical protein
MFNILTLNKVLLVAVLVIFAEESCTNCCKGTVKLSDDGGGGADTPVTLTLYHFVKLGGHSILAAILLFGSSLMEA